MLLLSNSVAPGHGFLEHALEAIRETMDGGRRLLFFAHASFEPDRYTEVMQKALQPLGVEVVPAHRHTDHSPELDLADAVFVGGGNAFRLLKAVRDLGLLDTLRERVHGGMPYLGASAGSNLACPTIRTTNDMPIVEPASLVALGLVPFQINPHYPERDAAPSAASRDERIGEFLQENDVPVVGLREGAWLGVNDDSIVLGGSTGGRLFERGAEPRDLDAGSDLSDLLNAKPLYDSPIRD
ncbi:MAG TPA: dipeptidase PepE [Gaiellaceae bacterium]|nr:dipeptidase PepE [Gaiellaceae bacterium]